MTIKGDQMLQILAKHNLDPNKVTANPMGAACISQWLAGDLSTEDLDKSMASLAVLNRALLVNAP
jgi:hypothetical protein